MKLVPLACIVILAMMRPASATDIFPYPVTTRVLANGLKVVMVPFDSPGIVAYYTIVRVGSRNEVEPGHSGFAHFFEHMMFRGTERFSTQEYNEVYKLLGADTNAYTSSDRTVYHELFGSAGLESAIDVESDRMMNLAYTEADFKQEAKAVLGEYNKNYSNPLRKLYERVRDTAYTTHTYKHTTMGFIDDIIDMPNQHDYSLKFFERHYTPSNTILLLVGDFEIEPTVAMIEKYYGPWNRKAYEQDIPVEPEQTQAKSEHIDWDNPTLPYLVIGFKTPAFSTENTDCAAIDVLSMMLFGENGSLYKKLVIQDQTVEMLDGGMPNSRDPGLFYIYARLTDVAHLDDVRNDIYGALAEAATTPIAADKLEKTKANLRYDLAMSLDTAAAVASALTGYLSLTGDPNTINETYRRYDEVTPMDIQRVATKYFDQQRSTEITLTGVTN